ncbi:MAG: cytochrome d ubiquinol oxidase subunit II [Candidatus Sulfotelmatobacter sp.]
MGTLWFMIVAVMVAAYVVLDGFDLGAGVIYLTAARTPQERQSILRAIGPYWDGNEVWLLAAGGTLYFAFPLLYASSFSGFYLPLMMVLWLLMLRGIGIELRGHSENPVWRGFFDVVFCLSSLLLCIFFGAALGNVVRGVPLGADHYFFEPLWTNFRVGADNGILDWYTVLTGVIALVTLTTHGSLFVATKTEGEVNRRASTVAKRLWPVQILLTVVGLVATVSIQPGVLDNYRHHAIGFAIPVLVFGALAIMMHAMAKGPDARAEKAAFVASAVYIVGMLVGAAFALYPVVLPASTDRSLDLTIYNTKAGDHGLTVGLTWWILGAILALGYFFFLFRMFRGKVRLEGEGY